MEICRKQSFARASQLQFGKQAARYVTSSTHRKGDSLGVLLSLAQLDGSECALDVGTGIGFTAFALACEAASVLATDITNSMLAEAKNEADKRKLDNVSFALADAENLPFVAETFQRVACRTAAHHFGDPEQAILEMVRVLSPNGLLLLADTVSPEKNDTAAWMHSVEHRRDPSHSRNLPISEWYELLTKAGLEVADMIATPITLALRDWAFRSGTNPDDTERLLEDFRLASPNIRDTFHIRQKESDISFQWQCAVFQARKPN